MTPSEVSQLPPSNAFYKNYSVTDVTHLGMNTILEENTCIFDLLLSKTNV
jgi:hypothetical protein